MKRLVLGLGLPVLLFSGAAGAIVWSGGPPEGTPGSGAPPGLVAGAGDRDNAGVHGGPIERFHGGGRCDLVDVGGLPGNWTHGDYVSAVAGAGDASLTARAARSECGKPMVAVRHGGPPAHAGSSSGPPAHAGSAGLGTAEENVALDPPAGPLGS